MTDKPKSHPHQGNPDPDKGGRDQYKRHVDGDIRVSGQIEVNPPPDSVKQIKSEQQDAKTYRKKNYIVSILTLAAVIIYAAITFWQGLLTREALHSVQRAFVWFSPKVGYNVITDQDTKKEFVDFTVPIENSGSTPTRGMLNHTNLCVSENQLPNDFSYPDRGDMSQIPVVLGPKEEIRTTPARIPFDRFAKPFYVYIYGWVSYNDAFQGTPRHTTRFCFQLTEYSYDVSTKKPTHVFFSICPRNNCTETDDECKNYKPKPETACE